MGKGDVALPNIDVRRWASTQVGPGKEGGDGLALHFLADTQSMK